MRDSNSGFFSEVGQHYFVRSVAFAMVVRPLRIEEGESDRLFRGLVTAGEDCGETYECADENRTDFEAALQL